MGGIHGGKDVVWGAFLQPDRDDPPPPPPPKMENPGCITKHAKTVNILTTKRFLKKPRKISFLCAVFLAIILTLVLISEQASPGDDHIKLEYN